MYLGRNIIFVLSSPRSGSTMLQRILGSHSKIQTHPEPHILTPLAFQGYFYQVEEAAYNHKVAAQAFREFVDYLPNKEDDYLHACRAYADVLYGCTLRNTDKRYFLDKTPNYADAILPYVEKLLPEAKFIVLTRHPLAVMSSDAHTFFGGNYDRAYYNRRLLETFVGPIAHFMRTTYISYIHVKYEDLVTDPESQIGRLLGYLDLEFESACLNFGEIAHITKTFGDPKIGMHKKPVTDSVHAWVRDLYGRPDRLALCKRILQNIPASDLITYGYPYELIWKPFRDFVFEHGPSPSKMNLMRHLNSIKWRAIRYAQKMARTPPFNNTVRRMSRYCDALLR